MLLKELSEAYGVSGHEDAVRQLIREAIQDQVDEHRTDALGNLIAFKKGSGRSRRRVMVAAHMDEIGLMIMYIEKQGALRFRAIGGIDPRILLAKKVRIGDRKVPGVIGITPIHLLDRQARQQVADIKDMSIDVGASSREEAEKLVNVGDYAAFETPFAELAGDLRVAKGKAFDDRAGCTVLTELLRESYPFDLYAVFTVQEEVGLRGATVAAHGIAPDLAFVLEGTTCDELPSKRDVSTTTTMGAGPALTIMDRSVIADRRLVGLLVETAEKSSIPYQFKQPAIGGTDAGAIHLSREGVPSAVISVPSRNIHCPACLLSLNDLENTVRLMREALAHVPHVHLSY